MTNREDKISNGQREVELPPKVTKAPPPPPRLPAGAGLPSTLEKDSDRKPTWSVWCDVPQVKVWEGVALSLGIEPRKVRFATGWNEEAGSFSESQVFKDRLLIACRNHEPQRIAVSLSNPADAEVHLPEFAAWSVSIDWEIPSEMTGLASKANVPSRAELEQEVKRLQTELQQQCQARWPWGDHTTNLLGYLAAAAEKWWKNYDQSDATTAPTNVEVKDWLVKEYRLASRVAAVMAQVLRADDVPKGPRPAKSKKTSRPSKS